MAENGVQAIAALDVAAGGGNNALRALHWGSGWLRSMIEGRLAESDRAALTDAAESELRSALGTTSDLEVRQVYLPSCYRTGCCCFHQVEVLYLLDPDHLLFHLVDLVDYFEVKCPEVSVVGLSVVAGVQDFV